MGQDPRRERPAGNRMFNLNNNNGQADPQPNG